MRKASHVVVKLGQDEAKVSLVVDDNGRGFSFSGQFTKRGAGPVASRANFDQRANTERRGNANGGIESRARGASNGRNPTELKMTKAKQVIRILVADDHAIFRDGLRKLLEAADEIQIVGEASNGNECVKMLAKLKPDIFCWICACRRKTASACWKK